MTAVSEGAMVLAYFVGLVLAFTVRVALFRESTR